MNGIGARIKSARKARGLTQEQLAEACGWSGQSRIGNYETGKREPSAADMQLIAAALGIPVTYLWVGPEAPPIRVGEPAVPYPPNRGETALDIPIVDIATVGDEFLRQDSGPAMMAADWTICPVKHGVRTFAFRMPDDSMTAASAKSIPKDFFLWVDPDQRESEHDKPVLARLDGGQLVVAQYMRQAGREWLHLLNTAYPPLSGPFEVVGRVIFKGEET